MSHDDAEAMAAALVGNDATGSRTQPARLDAPRTAATVSSNARPAGKRGLERRGGAAMTRRDEFWMTCTHDQRDHVVTEHDVVAGRCSGHYHGLCGREVVPCSLMSPPGPVCKACAQESERRAGAARESPGVGWLAALARAVRKQLNTQPPDEGALTTPAPRTPWGRYVRSARRRRWPAGG